MADLYNCRRCFKCMRMITKSIEDISYLLQKDRSNKDQVLAGINGKMAEVREGLEILGIRIGKTVA